MKSFKKIISGVTALALACGLSLSASAELKAGDYKAYKGAGYMAKCEVVSVKDGKSTVKVTLKNTSKKTINHWAVGFEGYYYAIEDIKYGSLFTPEYPYNTVIRDCGTNGTVAPNQCVSFSFTMQESYAFHNLPERLKIYSDINKSNTVDELNTAARECYHSAMYCIGGYINAACTVDTCFGFGLFENSNSKDGMKTGFNYKYKAKGDSAINMAASQYARGNISVYVGRTEIDGKDSCFVQVRDNKTGKVGQFPHPTDGTAEWGTFDLDAPAQANFSDLQLSAAAKVERECVQDYLYELMSEGQDYQSIFEHGSSRATSDEGLKIDMKASYDGLDKVINDRLKFDCEGMIVYVGKIPSDDKFIFSVKTKDPKTGETGLWLGSI